MASTVATDAQNSIRDETPASHTQSTTAPLETNIMEQEQATAGAHPSEPEGAEGVPHTTLPVQSAMTTTPAPTTDDATTSHPPLARAQTEALGPALPDDTPTPMPLLTNPLDPTKPSTTLAINLMLTTGAKHPYNLSEKYLTSRNAMAKNTAGVFDAKMLTGYKLKELIWQDWRKEWEARPASPASIRLITMGKMIEDGKTLSDYSFALDRSNVVHMTIKPADFDQDDETGGKHAGKGSSIRMRDGGDGGAGCRCVIL